MWTGFRYTSLDGAPKRRERENAASGERARRFLAFCGGSPSYEMVNAGPVAASDEPASGRAIT